MFKRKKLFILSVIILLIGFLFYGVIYINRQKNNSYQFKNKTYYEVTLKPNAYFSNDKKVHNQYYIAASIKSVDIYFDYYLKDNNKDAINYSYDITATLKSYADNGTKLILTKNFNLKSINNVTKEEINIKEKYNLDYEYYVNYVKSFEEYYNIKTESYLDVKLNIKINDENNSNILLNIPINENIVEIEMKEDNTFLENNKQNNLSKLISFIFIGMAIIIIISKSLILKDNEEDILKEYQDIIINIQNKPNINSKNIIYLNNLKDLITIALNNNINIFNYQNNYYTIIDNTYYIYIFPSLG